MNGYVSFFWCGAYPPHHVWKNIYGWVRHLQESGSDFTVLFWVSQPIFRDFCAKYALRKAVSRDPNGVNYVSYRGLVVLNFDNLLSKTSLKYRQVIHWYHTLILNKLFPIASEISRILILNDYPGFYVDVDILPNNEERFLRNLDALSGLGCYPRPRPRSWPGWKGEIFLMSLSYQPWDRKYIFENWIVFTAKTKQMTFLLDNMTKYDKKKISFDDSIRNVQEARMSEQVIALNRNPFCFKMDERGTLVSDSRYVEAFRSNHLEYAKLNREENMYFLVEELVENYWGIHIVFEYMRQVLHFHLGMGQMDTVPKGYIDFYFAHVGKYFCSSQLQDGYVLYTWANPGYGKLCDYQRSVATVEKYYLERQERRIAAATNIQRIGRGFLARRQARRLLEERD